MFSLTTFKHSVSFEERNKLTDANQHTGEKSKNKENFHVGVGHVVSC